MTSRSRRIVRAVLSAALLTCAAHGIAPRAASATGTQTTTYTGSDCVSENWPNFMMQNISAETGFMLTPFGDFTAPGRIECPVWRTIQDASHLDVGIRFGNITPGTQITCQLFSATMFDDVPAQGGSFVQASSPGDPLFMTINLTLDGASSFYSPMGDDATAFWRTFWIGCGADSGTFSIFEYQVQES